MRILWHSAAPWVNTGYGRCTREITGRLHNGEHEVAIQPMAAVKKSPVWWHGEEAEYELEEPMKVYNAQQQFGLGNVAENFEDFDADLLFTHFDTWMEPARKMIPRMDIPYASYVIVDHDPAPEAVTEQVKNAQTTVAMSDYAVGKLQEKRVRPEKIPHGIDPDKYHPLPDNAPEKPDGVLVKGENGEREVNLDDLFVVGMVAANHGDRKNIPNQMVAFKRFLEDVTEDALMYIHTNPASDKGYQLDDVRKEIGLPKDKVIWTSPSIYHDVDDEYLNGLYNSFDIFTNCSFGESWGLCITESMAAGTPAVVTDFSSMPEQIGLQPGGERRYITSVGGEEGERGGVVKGKHGIAVVPSIGLYREKVSAKQYIAHPEDIKDAFEYYYKRPEKIEKHGEKAAEFVRDNYTWENHVIPDFKSMFNRIKQNIKRRKEEF